MASCLSLAAERSNSLSGDWLHQAFTHTPWSSRLVLSPLDLDLLLPICPSDYLEVSELSLGTSGITSSLFPPPRYIMCFLSLVFFIFSMIVALAWAGNLSILGIGLYGFQDLVKWFSSHWVSSLGIQACAWWSRTINPLCTLLGTFLHPCSTHKAQEHPWVALSTVQISGELRLKSTSREQAEGNSDMVITWITFWCRTSFWWEHSGRSSQGFLCDSCKLSALGMRMPRRGKKSKSLQLHAQTALLSLVLKQT